MCPIWHARQRRKLGSQLFQCQLVQAKNCRLGFSSFTVPPWNSSGAHSKGLGRSDPAVCLIPLLFSHRTSHEAGGGREGQWAQLNNFAHPIPPTKYTDYCPKGLIAIFCRIKVIFLMPMGNVVASRRMVPPNEVETCSNERNCPIFTRKVLTDG